MESFLSFFIKLSSYQILLWRRNNYSVMKVQVIYQNSASSSTNRKSRSVKLARASD